MEGSVTTIGRVTMYSGKRPFIGSDKIDWFMDSFFVTLIGACIVGVIVGTIALVMVAIVTAL